MPALTFEVLSRVEERIFGARALSVNGYRYAWNSMPPPPTREIIERGPLPVWRDEYVPRISDFCTRVRSADYDSMDAPQTLEALELAIDDAIEAFRYTMVMVFAFMGPTFELVGFAEEELGEGGDQILAALLQGFENGTASAGAGLSEHADLAAGLPDVAAALKEGRTDLEAVPGGAKFATALQKYLDEYGWRAESWGLPHVPTWAETPEVPLHLIGRYIADAAITPAAALARSRQQREEAMREVETRLSGEKLEQFKERLAAGETHVPISEDRARWQLTIMGSIRVPALALGHKLVASGVMSEPNDVFFLSLPELKSAAKNPDPSLRAEVKRRKAELQRQEKLAPPPFIGATPDAPPPEAMAIVTKFFGIGVVPSTEEKLIKGNAASRGVVTGRARIIHDLTETHRLQKGDILVCPTTAPPWTPLFAIASAVVTDTGGILSHSAICAREYGIPCVAGTQVATRQIPDGATITVDGAAGTVRIEA